MPKIHIFRLNEFKEIPNRKTVLKKKNSSFLFSAILCVVEVCPHHVFSQDFQDQAIPGQEAKTESSHSSMDSNENWQ